MLQKLFFLAIIQLLALLHAEEHVISISNNIDKQITPFHWRHSNTNSAIYINNIEIDIIRIQLATKNQESIKVDLFNTNWSELGVNKNNVNIPEIINIGKTSNFRGTPLLYIEIIPWKIENGIIKSLTQADISITYTTFDESITFKHPYLINKNQDFSTRSINTNSTEYLIIAPAIYSEAAHSIANMHKYEVNIGDRINTEILFTDDISPVLSSLTGLQIRDMINQHIVYNPNLKYLLLLGDISLIPPIYNSSQSYPSDDYYSTPEDNMYQGIPYLSTGRIPASSLEEAQIMIEKIRKYMLEPAAGIWRSKIALVSDDVYKDCAIKTGEEVHTEYSNNLFNRLKDIIPLNTFYGPSYDIKQTSSGCRYPDLTSDLIQNINNGLALINYIGHGSPDTWAGERLLSQSRDLPLIKPEQNKLAIWVAGTCSFGDYSVINSFMKELLFNDGGAISIIATTDAIGYNSNWNYLDNFFSGIESFLINGDDIRLGDLVRISKNGDKKFHNFGDPALKLPFPRKTEGLISNNNLSSINIIDEEQILFNEVSQNSSLIIKDKDKNITINYGFTELTYTIPGQTYIQVDTEGDTVCFHIPIDANTCEDCLIIQAYQQSDAWTNKIDIVSNLSLSQSSNEILDFSGPKISIWQKDLLISNGSHISSDIGLNISIEDESGINLMETIGHGIRYTFDNKDLSLIKGENFIFTNCSGGYASIPIPASLDEGKHTFYIEAWDGVNNKSFLDLELYLDLSINKDHSIKNIYPIPNPFSNTTYFTMQLSQIPSFITISIYSLHGNLIKTIKKEVINEFSNKISWDGKDKLGYEVANGTYLYHLKAESKGNVYFENLYTVTKIK